MRVSRTMKSAAGLRTNYEGLQVPQAGSHRQVIAHQLGDGVVSVPLPRHNVQGRARTKPRIELAAFVRCNLCRPHPTGSRVVQKPGGAAVLIAHMPAQ